MIRRLLIPFFITLSFSSGMAQVTITSSDLTHANDTFRVSNAVITSAIDPVPTGAGFTWDFSFLEWNTQDVDTFFTVSAMGTTYSFVFSDIPQNQNRSNQATRGAALPAINLGGFAISDLANFYLNASAGFTQTGIGANINGFGVPIPFTTKDRIYKLPLNYGNSDTCHSSYQLSLPGLGYLGHQQDRSTEVDGWGTLITPYGTFDVLRVRSLIVPHDSLYLDTLGFGFGFSLPPTIEYKWLAPGKGIPVLQINTSMGLFGGGESVTSVVYLDSLRPTVVIPPDDPEDPEDPQVPLTTYFNVYPSPSNGPFTMELSVTEAQNAEVKLYSVDGKLVTVLYKGGLEEGVNKIPVNTFLQSVAAGYYVVEARFSHQVFRERMIITSPN